MILDNIVMQKMLLFLRKYLSGSQLDDLSKDMPDTVPHSLSKDMPDAVPHSLQTMQCSAFLAGMFGSGLMR